MMMDLDEVRRIATEVIGQTPWLEFLGVIGGTGGTGHVELLVGLLGCRVEPCRLMLSLNRGVSADALRHDIFEKLTDASTALMQS